MATCLSSGAQGTSPWTCWGRHTPLLALDLPGEGHLSCGPIPGAPMVGRGNSPPKPRCCFRERELGGGLERGTKSQFSTFSSFISTINQKKEAAGSSSSPTQLVIPNIKNVRDLPPICLDVRQKQRISIDTLPPDLKAPVPPEASLPIRTKTMKDFQEDMEKTKLSGDWKAVHDFYLTTFDSFLELNAAFKKDVSLPFSTIEDSGINAKFVNAVYDALLNTPQDIQKSVLKGIINGLLQEWKGPRTKDDLRAYCILLQNPQFSNTSTYVIYAHLLRQIATLAEADHHFLAHWFKK
uniref:Uncharacterized protein n=1 Tax=Gopherus evgoodei TaxID=1825980 RepID=A0A8C4VWQ2_9SAUR